MEFLAIIKEELLSHSNVFIGVDSNPVVSVDKENFHITVWLATVISKPYFSSHPENKLL